MSLFNWQNFDIQCIVFCFSGFRAITMTEIEGHLTHCTGQVERILSALAAGS